MLEIVLGILKVASGLSNLIEKFRGIRRDRRDRAAQYFSDLAVLIEEASASLKIRKYPGGKCAQILAAAQSMPKVLGTVIGQSKANTFQKQLLEVHRIEQLHTDFSRLKDRTIAQRLQKLDEAAGIFRAMAADLRVSD